MGNPAGSPKLGMGSPLAAGRRLILPNRLQTMALLYANPYSTNNMGYGESWTTAEVGMSPSIRGANWTVYRNRCFDLGAPYKSFYLSTNSDGQPIFQINNAPGGVTDGFGDVVAMYAGANFDYIAWGYSPPQSWLQRVDYWAARAGRPAPKQGFYFFNFHDCNQSVQYDALGTELRQIQIDTGELYESSVSALSGCTHVDIYATNGSGAACSSGSSTCGVSHARGTASTHCWELDYSSPSNMSNLATQMATVLRDRLATYWPVRPPDFILTDNALASPYGGTADNWVGSALEGMSGEEFRAEWVKWPTAFKLYNPGLEFWGNHGAPDETYYSASLLKARYGEFAFTSNYEPGSTSANLATLQARILAAKTVGSKWAPDHPWRSGGSINGWHESNGPGGGLTWTALSDYAKSIGALDNFIAIASRTSSGFYTHYQPEFGPF